MTTATMEFDPYSDEFFNDPSEIYRWLRDESPVYKSERYGFWALSRFADVAEASRDWQRLSSRWGHSASSISNPEPPGLPEGFILNIDPPEHERLRKLVSRAFTPHAAAGYERVIREVVGQCADALEGRDEFDWVDDFVALFPVEVIAGILGVPPEQRQQIRLWTDELLSIDPEDPGDRDIMTLVASLYTCFLDLAKERRADPRDDMISYLVLAEVEADGDGEGRRKLSDDEVAGFALLLGAAGSETVVKLLGNLAVLLDRHRDQWNLLLDDRSLLSGAIEEANRYYPPSQYQGRHTLAPVTYQGIEIPAGEGILLLTGAATHDEREFDDPDAFRIQRHIPVQLSFGHGIHFCIGAHLARLESRIAMETLIERWPNFTVDTDNLARVHMSNVAGYSNVPIHTSPPGSRAG